jgi:hypothetical protein
LCPSHLPLRASRGRVKTDCTRLLSMVCGTCRVLSTRYPLPAIIGRINPPFFLCFTLLWIVPRIQTRERTSHTLYIYLHTSPSLLLTHTPHHPQCSLDQHQERSPRLSDPFRCVSSPTPLKHRKASKLIRHVQASSRSYNSAFQSSTPTSAFNMKPGSDVCAFQGPHGSLLIHVGTLHCDPYSRRW